MTNTIFVERSAQLFVFDFGASDSGRDIGYELKQRVGPSIALAIPSFVLGIQWHPEFMDPADAELLDGKPLQAAFIAACRSRKATGRPMPVEAVKAA